jgi:hypothetical protein
MGRTPAAFIPVDSWRDRFAKCAMGQLAELIMINANSLVVNNWLANLKIK